MYLALYIITCMKRRPHEKIKQKKKSAESKEGEIEKKAQNETI